MHIEISDVVLYNIEMHVLQGQVLGTYCDLDLTSTKGTPPQGTSTYPTYIQRGNSQVCK